MYKKQNRDKQKDIRVVSLEDLVPRDHLLRKIDRAINFDFIYEEVKDLYSATEWGKPGIDPVSLFKIVLIQHLYGIRSMRQTIKEIEVNMAYRWFIGYDLFEKIPHFSTFSKNYTRRFQGTQIFERIFEKILEEAINSGYVDASAVFIDGTHVKASANKKKNRKVEIEATAKAYQEQLDEEIRKDREAHGKRPLKKDDDSDDNEDGNIGGTGERKTITESTTDPESGLFHKGEHEKQFAYVANTACDRHNFVLGFVLGAGNIHDSQMFSGIYQKVIERFPQVEAVAIDAGYKTPGIMKEILDNGKIPCTPYKRPMTKDGFFKKNEYVYDEYYDCIICPNNQPLKYSTTNKEGYKEYKSDPAICSKCAMREKCTQSKNCQKVVTRHVWAEYMEKAEDYRHTPQYKKIYAERKQTIERVFACAKEQHGMRYTHLRGLARVTSQLTLLFASMNLKKLATWKDRNGLLCLLEKLLIIVKGYFRIPKVPFLSTVCVIDSNVNDVLERILIAHELGHAVLHTKIAMMKGFQEMEVLDGRSQDEDEANFFAAELLLEDKEVLECLSKYSFFETAKQLYVPAALLDYKFSLLHEKGELVSPMYIRKTKFLKDDLGDYDDANHFEYE